MSAGIQKSLKIIFQYPGLLLSPVFSYWTFGKSNICCKRNSENQFKVSFRLTWINAVITALGIIGLSTADLLRQRNSQMYLLDHMTSWSCLVVSWITLIILNILPKCQKFCCTSCPLAYQETYLNPDNLDELIDPSSENPKQQDIELVVQSQHSREICQPSNLEDIRTLPKKLKNLASGSVLTSDEPKQSKVSFISVILSLYLIIQSLLYVFRIPEQYGVWIAKLRWWRFLQWSYIRYWCPWRCLRSYKTRKRNTIRNQTNFNQEVINIFKQLLFDFIWFSFIVLCWTFIIVQINQPNSLFDFKNVPQSPTNFIYATFM